MWSVLVVTFSSSIAVGLPHLELPLMVKGEWCQLLGTMLDKPKHFRKDLPFLSSFTENLIRSTFNPQGQDIICLI